jgi:penicillin-binding protein 1A
MLLGKKKIKHFSNNTKKINTSKYSYFIDYSMYEAKRKLKTIDIKGLKIYTSLNRKLQRVSEAVMKSNLAKLSMLNKKTEGALILIDSKSGAIITMVGGNEFIKGDFNRVYQSKRAVGSTFKPIIYLMALEKGLISPNSILKDEPVSYKGKNEKWTPKNWDGEYLGNLDVKKSLELSRNTIAIKLASKIGVEQIIQRAKTFGITDNLPQDLSISIGSAGMTLKELGGVYSMFSREGKYIAPYAVTKILVQNGEEIYKTKVVFNRVASQKSTKQLNNLLEQRKDSQIFQKLKNQNVPIYGKTGTSDKFRDLWFSGYNQDITGIIWIGNDNNQPMTKVYSTHCSEIWLELANYYYDFKN